MAAGTSNDVGQSYEIPAPLRTPKTVQVIKNAEQSQDEQERIRSVLLPLAKTASQDYELDFICELAVRDNQVFYLVTLVNDDGQRLEYAAVPPVPRASFCQHTIDHERHAPADADPGVGHSFPESAGAKGQDLGRDFLELPRNIKVLQLRWGCCVMVLHSARTWVLSAFVCGID